jgi:hypothetical protein
MKALLLTSLVALAGCSAFAPPARDGAPCSTDAGCKSERCAAGSCAGSSCCLGNDCLVDQKCDTGWTCKEGFLGLGGRCIKTCRCPDLQPCDCPAGNVCRSGVCDPPPAPKPVVSAGGPYEGPLGQPITLRGEATVSDNSGIADWSWSVGAAEPLKGQTVQHTFTQSGIHAIGLEVRAGNGQLASTTGSVRICHPAESSCYPSGTDCCAPASCQKGADGGYRCS